MHVEKGERLKNPPPVPALGAPAPTLSVRVYSRDPSLRANFNAITTINVRLAEPRDSRFDLHAGDRRPSGLRDTGELRLLSPAIAAAGGHTPSTTSGLFAQQMVYAVATWTIDRFRRALGREPDFAPSNSGRLRLDPYAFEEANAYYDPSTLSLQFGWYRQTLNAPGRTQRGALVQTALSHDIVVHETAHALLDGLRGNLLVPTNVDVLAFHEGFADLIALFAHFTQRTQLELAIADAPDDLAGGLMIELARQFGQTVTGSAEALRKPIIDDAALGSEAAAKIKLSTISEPHLRGSILASAVYEAFRDVYVRKSAGLRVLCKPGERPSPALVSALATIAERLADQFLDLIIRAVDYLPPVDINFGEFLRAMLTADRALVPDDPWGYREALVYAFRRFQVDVEGVVDLSEAALVWEPPDVEFNCSELKKLALLSAHFGLRPARAMARGFKYVQQFLVENKDKLDHLGLCDGAAAPAQSVGPIRVESLRLVHRVGPDRTLALGFVIELVQRRTIDGFGQFLGGCTVICDHAGNVEYVVSKDVLSARRLRDQQRYLAGPGLRYAAMMINPGDPAARASLIRAMHDQGCACSAYC